MESLRSGDPRQIGPYRIEGRLGEGGMGQVFRGVSPGGRAVAVKVIRAEHAGRQQFRRRFALEVEAARRVGGFHTAQVVDADTDAAEPWLVTAFVNGLSLHETVTAQGPFGADRLRPLAAGLAEGLSAIHACGLVHRDLKPGNVIMAEDGPRIIDFGIAQAADADVLTPSGVVVGTYAFMSPEQIRDEGAGPASDVFSLGCVLAFAATGRSPFAAATIPATIHRILDEPPRLDGAAEEFTGLLTACLAKDPGERPSADDILAGVSGTGPVAARKPTVVDGAAVAGLPTQTAPGRRATPPAQRSAPGPGPGPGPEPEPAGPGPDPAAGSGTGRRTVRRRAIVLGAAALVAGGATATVAALRTGHAGAPQARTVGSGQALALHADLGGAVTSVAFSPDGGTLATTTGDGKIWLWHVATRKPLATLVPPASEDAASRDAAVAFSPDGRMLAGTTDGGRGQTWLWDVTARRTRGVLTGNDVMGRPLTGVVVFSPDGRTLAGGDSSTQTGDGSVSLWDVATRRRIADLPDAESPAWSAAFSPDNTTVAVGTDSGVELVDLASRDKAGSLDTGSGGSVVAVAFSPDGRLLACGVTDPEDDAAGVIQLWDLATRKQAASLDLSNVSTLAFSPNGRLLAGAGSDSGLIRLWDPATRVHTETLDTGTAAVRSLAFSPDGTLLAGGGTRPMLWRITGG